MPADNHGPFPRETVRDLLGITRGLYCAELAVPPTGADPRRLDALVEIGKELRLALELAAKGGPGSMGMRAAWMWAEKGAHALGELVGETMPIAPVVSATIARLRCK